MNYQDLEHYLKSHKTDTTIDEQTVYNHFIHNHDTVPYEGGFLSILGGNREFYGKNHLISLHNRNYPKIPFHIYHYIKINYVYSGTMTIVLENETVVLNQGDIMIIDKHVPHSILKTSNQDLAVNIILKEEFFTDKFINHLPEDTVLSKFLRQMLNGIDNHNHYLIYYHNEDYLIHQCIQNILCEYLDPQVCSDELIDNYIMILITQLIRKYEYITNLNPNKKMNQQLFQHIFNYIENHYVEGNLTSLCKQLGYDVSYISNMIQKETGKTFKKWIIDERVKKAALLLKNTDLPIYEISQTVGFHNLTSFYEKFKDKYQCKPKEYRMKNKES